MKIKLNNDMDIVLSNEDGVCMAGLVDSDGEVILADVIDEEFLFEFIRSQMSAEGNSYAKKVAEIRTMEKGTPILVCDGQLAYLEAYEASEDGDYTLWFTDDGLYKNPDDGEYYDLETHEKVEEYIGNCSLGEYIGKA